MNSAIYRGWIRHRRMTPVRNTFAYRAFMLYLDLDELDSVFAGRWMWSAKRIAPAWFREADHLRSEGDLRLPLRCRVEAAIERRGIAKPRGPIRLLTNLRHFGYVMNPVSFFYCFDESGERVKTIVAEITNTPWGERHCYVLDRSANIDPRPGFQRHQFEKKFHVSPFMQMTQEYDWRFADPAARAFVHMDNIQEGRKIFDATMAMNRQPITGGNLATCLMRHPLMTAEVTAKIYWQALKLRMKGCPFVPHPRHLKEAVS